MTFFLLWKTFWILDTYAIRLAFGVNEKKQITKLLRKFVIRKSIFHVYIFLLQSKWCISKFIMVLKYRVSNRDSLNNLRNNMQKYNSTENTIGFLMFSGGIERNQRHEMGACYINWFTAWWWDHWGASLIQCHFTNG